jgi:hypothetical protein
VSQFSSTGRRLARCRRAIWVGLLLGALLVPTLSSDALGAHRLKPPRRPMVGAQGLFVRASLGSFCVQQQTGNTATGLCGDAAPPTKPPQPRLLVDQGDRITMLFRHRHGLDDRPGRVRLSLARIRQGKMHTLSWRGQAHRVRGHPWRWRVSAPDQVLRANYLTIDERFPAGDAEYSVGLKHG